MGTKTHIALLNWEQFEGRECPPGQLLGGAQTPAEGNGWPLGREQSLAVLGKHLPPPALHLPAHLIPHHKLPALRLFFGRSGKREPSASLSHSKWKTRTRPENGNNTANLLWGKGRDGKKHGMDTGDEETGLEENARRDRRKHCPAFVAKDLTGT